MEFPRSISALPISLLAILVSVGLWGPPAAQAQHPTAVTSIVNSAQDTTLEVNHAGGLLMPGKLDSPFDYSAPDDSIPAEGAGTRLMWYPEKAAFRAGTVGLISSKSDVWNADSIGYHSVAFGLDTRASDFGAMALGRFTTASGQEATAMGSATTASGNAATAMGEETTASGIAATAMGRFTTASGYYATAMGDSTTAGGNQATAMGDATIARGIAATAMGQYADAARDNTFVWADGSNSAADKFSSGDDPNGSGVTGSQTFHVKATGGVRFVTGGGTTYISGGSAGWSNTSTRSAKTDVSSVDPVQVLKAVQSMPISTWEYKDDSREDEDVRHMGPMAEDFHGELPYELGSSENHINSINADGVALAAIKGLTRKVTKQKNTISELKAENDAINERLAALEAERPSSFAGFGGSAGLLVFGLLLGGLLGAGLLWRRREA